MQKQRIYVIFPLLRTANTVKKLTNGWYGVDDFILFQFEEYRRLPRLIESQHHYPHLHLTADVDSIILRGKKECNMSWNKLHN